MLKAAITVLAAVLLLPACSSDAAEDDATLQVSAAFYPLQYVVERVGGDGVDVTSLTPPGAEPHDLEPTPQDLADLQESDLVVHLSGFQPAVDEAIEQASGPVELDAADSADLERTYSVLGSDDGALDPHFWLDLDRLAAVATAVEEAMSAADPEQAETYAANLRALTTDLTELDEEYDTGLADCDVTQLVTAHESFGYLARRHGLVQVGIAGLSPTSEPDPRQLASVADLVEREGVRTIYTEALVSPAVSETIAEETGAETAVLDPVEALTDESAGADYLSVMRANLETLREGQGCR